MKASRKSVLALIGAMAVGAAVAAPSVEIVSVQQQYPWTNTVDIVYNVAGVASDTNGYFVAFTPTTQEGTPILDVNGESSIQVALTCTTNGAVAQWFPQTNQQYTACKMTPAVYRGGSGGGNDYMIVDLETGNISYEPMATQEASNEKYNTDEYKTKKLVLRKVNPGPYTIGNDVYDATTVASGHGRNSAHTVVVPEGTCYYIGVFPVTVAQYQYVMGTDLNSTDKTPYSSTSTPWNTFRANALSSAKLPKDANHRTSFLIRLRGKTDADFDLPTEEMLEIAYKAGTTTVFYWGDTINGDYCWHSGNSGNAKHEVGLKLPNPWGLYDTAGNIGAYTLDWHNTTDLALKAKSSDIYTPMSTGVTNRRKARGGYYGRTDYHLSPSHRDFPTANGADFVNQSGGIRLAVIFR